MYMNERLCKKLREMSKEKLLDEKMSYVKKREACYENRDITGPLRLRFAYLEGFCEGVLSSKK